MRKYVGYLLLKRRLVAVLLADQLVVVLRHFWFLRMLHGGVDSIRVCCSFFHYLRGALRDGYRIEDAAPDYN